MRRFLFTLGVLALFAIPVRAQVSRLEVFGGYSYGQFNGGDVLTSGRHFAMSGWHAAANFRLIGGLGLVADFSGYLGTSEIQTDISGAGDFIPLAVHDRYNIFMAGPELGIHFGRLRPFAHGLVGVTRNHSFVRIQPVFDSSTITRLSAAVGGGLDWDLTKHVALRVIQVDYILNSFPNTDPTGTILRSGHQHNVRASAGIVIRFGRR